MFTGLRSHLRDQLHPHQFLITYSSRLLQAKGHHHAQESAMEKQNPEIDNGNKGGDEVAATGTRGGPAQLGGKGPTTRATKRKRMPDKMQEVDHRPGDSGVTSLCML
jgi:hypothetical protein